MDHNSSNNSSNNNSKTIHIVYSYDKNYWKNKLSWTFNNI